MALTSEGQRVTQQLANAARLSLALPLLGLDGLTLSPLLGVLQAQLAQRFVVWVEDDLAGAGFSTGPVATARATFASSLTQALPAAAAAIETLLGRPGLPTFTARVRAGRVALRLESTGAREAAEDDALAARLGDAATVAALAGALAPLGQRSNLGIDLDGGVVTQLVGSVSRIGGREAAAQALPGVVATMAALGATPAQQKLFQKMHAPLSARCETFGVRLAASAGKLRPEVTISYAGVPQEHVIRLWVNLHPQAGLAEKLGTVVGALGAPETGVLELSFRDREPPGLVAGFELGTQAGWLASRVRAT